MGDNELSELILKTKVFYFNRYVTLIPLFAREAVTSLNWASVTGHSINHEDVQDRYTADLNGFHAQSGNECSQTSLGTDHGEKRVLTFAELRSLIEQGKTDNIPNNKIIPDILNVSGPANPVRLSCFRLLESFPGRHSQRINCTIAEKALGTRQSIVIHMIDRAFTTLYTELRQRLNPDHSNTSVGEKTSLISLISGSRNES